MKSTIRIKKINGKEYWYEDTPYYDKERKQIRHTSKYLGKNIGGKPVKVRQELIDNPKSLMDTSPRRSFNYGELLPLLDIIKELHIDGYLNDLFNGMEKDMLITLCINRIVRPMAMYNIKTWYEASALSLDFPDLPITSQNISELFEKIGESSIPDLFMEKMVGNLGTKSTLMYDITSLSSYSRLIELLEFGYSRDDPSLPQINLSMIVDKDFGIPIIYDVYPGSIVDVTTLKNTIQKVEAYGVKDYTLVMDRGFFSKGNLQELTGEGLSFIIPATMALKSVKELMSKTQKEVRSPRYLQMFNEEPIFVKPVTLSLDEKEFKGYCYYTPKREQDERNAFYTRLYEVTENIQKTAIPSWRNPAEVFKERSRGMAKYLKWKLDENHFKVKIRQNAVAQIVNRMGTFIIFYNGDFDWMHCLFTYRERDIIEKGFCNLKNEIKTLPLNTQKESTTRGFLFMSFLSLILRMRLLNRMKNTGLLKKYTIEKMLLELEKLRKVQLSNDKIIVTEMTSKQKNIIKTLNLCA
jgi:transposase